MNVNKLLKSLINKVRNPHETTIVLPEKKDEDPVSFVTNVMAEHSELIEYTKRAFGGGKLDGESFNFDNLFQQVITNYIEYCFDLPASEGYHHSRKGGLITHSLQVANRSLRQAKNQFLPSTKPLDVERKRTGRYYYGAWLCGLLHDAGKMYTDMIVHDKDNSDNEWKPLVESFTTWMSRTGVMEYNVIWRKDRLHKKHDNMSINILHHVLTPAARKYIAECPDDLLSEITDALSGYQHRHGFIHSAVRIADSISTAQDIKLVWDEQLGPRQAALHEKIIKAMQELCGGWITSGDLLSLQDEIYLRWPQCIDDVIKKLLEHDASIPHQSSTLLQTMTERGMVKGLLNEQYAMFYSNILQEVDAVSLLRGEHVKGGKGFIRIEWAFHVLGDKPLPPNSAGLLKITPEGDSILFSHNNCRIFTAEEIKDLQPNDEDTNEPLKPGNETVDTSTTNTALIDTPQQTTQNNDSTPPSPPRAKPKAQPKTQPKKNKKVKPKPLSTNPLMDNAKKGKVADIAPLTPCKGESEPLSSDKPVSILSNNATGKAEEIISILIEHNCFELIGTTYNLYVGERFTSLTKSYGNCLETIIAAKYVVPKSRIAHMMYDIHNGKKYIPASNQLNTYIHSQYKNNTPYTPSESPHSNKADTTGAVEKKPKNNEKIKDTTTVSSNTLTLKKLLINSLLDRGVNSPLLEQEDDILAALNTLELGKSVFVEDGKLQISFHQLCAKDVSPSIRGEICKGAVRTVERGNNDDTYIEY